MRMELGTLDRLTLAAWRLTNEAGWTFLAFVAATAAHVGVTFWLQSRFLVLSDAFNLNARAGAEDGIDDFVAKFGLRIGLTIALAVIIGMIVGRRVWRRHVAYAALAAAAYVIYILVWIEHSTSGVGVTIGPDGGQQEIVRRTTLVPAILYDLVVAATIPASAAVARRANRRKHELPAVLTDSAS